MIRPGSTVQTPWRSLPMVWAGSGGAAPLAARCGSCNQQGYEGRGGEKASYFFWGPNTAAGRVRSPVAPGKSLKTRAFLLWAINSSASLMKTTKRFLHS